MFVMSMRSSKIKIAVILAVGVVCIGAAILFAVTRSSRNTDASFPIKVRGASGSERINFLLSCGIEVEQEPAEVAEIIIPAEFDEVYKEYNGIQVSQGFNLEPYSGKRVKRWTYQVTNYPGYTDGSDAIRVNILVYDGLIIGGDVCSTELNGFMHGFIKDGTDVSRPETRLSEKNTKK